MVLEKEQFPLPTDFHTFAFETSIDVSFSSLVFFKALLLKYAHVNFKPGTRMLQKFFRKTDIFINRVNYNMVMLRTPEDQTITILKNNLPSFVSI